MNAPEFLDPKSVIRLKGETDAINSLRERELEAYSKSLLWGTYGPTGTDKLKVKKLNDLATYHLENILVTQDSVPHLYRKVILYILKNRY